MSLRVDELISAKKTTGAGSLKTLAVDCTTSFQATFNDVGESTTCTATVVIQVSNDGVGWIDAETLDISNSVLSSGTTLSDPWVYVRGNVTAISLGGDANASVTVTAAHADACCC